MVMLAFVIIIGIGYILWGLANVFFGYQFYRVSLLVVLCILGASIALIITRESPNYLQILIPGVLTIIFGMTNGRDTRRSFIS